MNVAAIIPAAGKGRRFGLGIPKLFMKVEGRPVLFYTLKNLCRAYSFKQIFIAADPVHFEAIQKIVRLLNLRNVQLVRGGSTRAQSVKNALLQVSGGVEWILVHDAARPMVSKRIIRSTIAMAQGAGGAIAAIPVTATVKRVNSRGIILKTEDRRKLYLAQTPQVFHREKLLQRYKKLGSRAFTLTDEASFFDGTAAGVRMVPGAVENIKITTTEDINVLRYYLKKRQNQRG